MWPKSFLHISMYIILETLKPQFPTFSEYVRLHSISSFSSQFFLEQTLLNQFQLETIFFDFFMQSKIGFEDERQNGNPKMKCGKKSSKYNIFSFQTDHTTGDPNGYYISLSRDTVQQPGDRGMLMSRDLPGSSTSQCISFWYYMYEPIVDNTGPNLGKLAVWIRTFDR